MPAATTTTLLGKTVGTTGFGLMSFLKPGRPFPSDDQIFETLKTALERGCNFWNAGEFYGTPDNNSLHILQRYFTKYPADAANIVLSIKGCGALVPDGSPEGIRRSVDNCNRILAGTKSIDIFQCARLDPKVPVETSIGTLKELVSEGKIGAIGMSEVGAEKIERALKVAPIAAVEVEVSIGTPDIFTNGVSALCAKHNIPIIGYGALTRGLMVLNSPEEIAPGSIMAMHPRLQGDALKSNMELVAELQKLAAAKNCSMAQLCISWVRSMSRRGGGAEIIMLAGCASASRVKENTEHIELSEKELKDIEDLISQKPLVGERYPPQLAAHWDR